MRYTDPSGDFVFAIFAIAVLWSAWSLGVDAGIAADRAGGSFMNGFWKGAAAGAVAGATGYFAGGALVSALNIGGILPGIIAGGVSGAIGGGLSGGLTTWAVGGNFWDGAKKGAMIGAVSGALSGGVAGYNIAKANGLNYWWGSEPAKDRTQWSLAWWDKPDIATSPIPFVPGTIESGCVPAGMEAITKSYPNSDLKYIKQDQYYWKTQYEFLTNENFKGVSASDIEGLVDQAGTRSLDPISSDYVLDNMAEGKRVAVGLTNYNGNSNHFMVIRKAKYWSNGNYRLTLMDPNGGTQYTLTRNQYYKYHSGSAFYSIYPVH